MAPRGQFNQAGSHTGAGLDAQRQRLEARFGYGWLSFGGRLAIMPDVRYESTETGRQYSHTWRLKQVGRTSAGLAVDVGALRREGITAGASPQHELLLRAGWQFEPLSGLDFSAQLEGALIDAATAATPAHRLGLTLRANWSPRSLAPPPSQMPARLQR